MSLVFENGIDGSFLSFGGDVRSKYDVRTTFFSKKIGECDESKCGWYR
jgi:hypothetical protein